MFVVNELTAVEFSHEQVGVEICMHDFDVKAIKQFQKDCLFHVTDALIVYLFAGTFYLLKLLLSEGLELVCGLLWVMGRGLKQRLDAARAV